METNCANCLRHLGKDTLKLNELEVNLFLKKTSYTRQVEIKTISVAAALSCVFNFPIVDPNLVNQIYCCVSCSTKVKELFKHYKTLLHYQKTGSFLAEKIEEGKRAWNFSTSRKTSNRNGTNNNTNKPVGSLKVVAVKTETNEVYGDDHGVFDYMENVGEQQNEDVIDLCSDDKTDEIDKIALQNTETLSQMGLLLLTSTKNSTNKTRQNANLKEQAKLKQSSSSGGHYQARFNLPTDEEYLKYKLNILNPPFSCPTCPVMSPTFDNYKDHVTKHLSENLFKCWKCEFVTSKFNIFESHCEQLHGFKPTSPPKLYPEFDLDRRLIPKAQSNGEEAIQWCMLHPHIIKNFTVPEGPPYKCGKCVIRHVDFDTKELYLQHMSRGVHKKKTYICPDPTCGEQFYGRQCKTRFVQHCEKKHQFKPEEACSISKITVGNEVKVFKVVGDPPYSCPEKNCPKTFETSQTLFTHLRAVHYTRREYTCSKCQKRLTAGSQKRHEKTCGKKKVINRKKIFLPPFICDICTTEFPSRLNLIKHVHKVHDPPPEKKWKCDICEDDVSFSKRHQLNSHMISHSTDRLACCDECGRSYKTEANLRFHKKIAHSDEGRQKYNAYCRQKNRRMKLARQQIQVQPTNLKTEQNQDDYCEGLELE